MTPDTTPRINPETGRRILSAEEIARALAERDERCGWGRHENRMATSGRAESSELNQSAFPEGNPAA